MSIPPPNPHAIVPSWGINSLAQDFLDLFSKKNSEIAEAKFFFDITIDGKPVEITREIRSSEKKVNLTLFTSAIHELNTVQNEKKECKMKVCGLFLSKDRQIAFISQEYIWKGRFEKKESTYHEGSIRLDSDNMSVFKGALGIFCPRALTEFV